MLGELDLVVSSKGNHKQKLQRKVNEDIEKLLESLV